MRPSLGHVVDGSLKVQAKQCRKRTGWKRKG